MTHAGGRPTLLTPELQETLVSYVRQGAYDWVAAETVGIGRTTFYRWMAEGEAKPRGKYREFWVKVSRARAEARTLAETTVRRENPLAWLRYGPGREKAGQPGWTETHEITGSAGGPIEWVVTYPDKKTPPD